MQVSAPDRDQLRSLAELRLDRPVVLSLYLNLDPSQFATPPARKTSVRSLIDEADWEEPEDGLDALEILVEEKVVPGRIGLTLVDLADYVTELGEASDYETGDDPVAFERLTEGVDATFDPPWADQCAAKPVACTQAFLYMAHGLGHGIGLEVHDQPHPWVGAGTFAAGDVFTIEPGVYVSRKLLEILPDTPKNRAMIAKVQDAVARYDNTGVRIEDDYLVTPSGVEWLSRAPREIAEVEAAMAER